MTLNEAMRALVAELGAGGVPAPLAQPLTLAALWGDLARLAGEPTPPEVAALLDGRGVILAGADETIARRPDNRRLRHDH